MLLYALDVQGKGDINGHNEVGLHAIPRRGGPTQAHFFLGCDHGDDLCRARLPIAQRLVPTVAVGVLAMPSPSCCLITTSTLY